MRDNSTSTFFYFHLARMFKMQIIPGDLPLWSATLKAANNWMKTMISLVRPQIKFMDVTIWLLLTKWLFLSVGMFVFPDKSIISMCCLIFAERLCGCDVYWGLCWSGDCFTLHFVLVAVILLLYELCILAEYFSLFDKLFILHNL